MDLRPYLMDSKVSYLDISLDDLDISYTTVEVMKLSLHDASE